MTDSAMEKPDNDKLSFGIILLANSSSHELTMLTRHKCHALLTVAGKPVIEHNLEIAADMSPDKVIVLAPEYDIDLAANIEDMDRWGMPVTYTAHEGSFDHPGIAKPYQDKFATLLIMTADRVRNIHANSMTALISDLATGIYHLDIDGRDSGISVCRHCSGAIGQVASEPDNPEPPATENRLELRTQNPSAEQYLITTPREYLDANLRIISDLPDAVSFRGQERFLGIFCGAGTRVDPRSTMMARGIIGRHCDIHPSAKLGGAVVIDDHVVIDRRTTIEDSLILDNSYVGEQLDLRNSIVSKNILINVDTGDVLEITDDFILADLTPDLFNTYLAQLTHQLSGALLLLLSLPFWIIAFVNALLTSDKGIARRMIYQGNERKRGRTTRRLFYTWEFNCTCGILRKLPLLISVAKGHIRLIGVSLYTPTEISRRPEHWKRVRDDLPVGLLGPTQLFLGTRAPLEERLLSDAVYRSQRSYRYSWEILWISVKQLRKLFDCGKSHLIALNRNPEVSGNTAGNAIEQQ